MQITSPETKLYAGNHELSIVDEGVRDDIHSWSLIADGTPFDRVRILRYYMLQAVTDDRFVAIWGGTRLYVIDLEGPCSRPFEHMDDIIAIHVKSRLWYICGETSVSLFDPQTGLDISRIEHDEIILRSFFRNDEFWIEDLSGRTLAVKL